MGGGVVALGNEDVVVGTALQRLVERNGRSHELLFDGTKTLKARLELDVVVGVILGDSRDDSNVVALGADVMG